MANTPEWAIYETTETNGSTITHEGTHGVSNVTGSLDRARTGFACSILSTDNLDGTSASVKELPSVSAALDPSQSSR